EEDCREEQLRHRRLGRLSRAAQTSRQAQHLLSRAPELSRQARDGGLSSPKRSRGARDDLRIRRDAKALHLRDDKQRLGLRRKLSSLAQHEPAPASKDRRANHRNPQTQGYYSRNSGIALINGAFPSS